MSGVGGNGSLITIYDKLIIAFYFMFILTVGLIFRRLSKNTSDYFRCGGAMPWWITGTSAWIAGFTAWTFVGAAGKVYETGTLVLWVYYGSVFAYVLVYAYTARRFRRTRAVTWMEAVRARFGPGTEQFYTWVKVPMALLMAGVSLNAIGVFMSTVFNLPMNTVLIALGVLVTIVAFAGGAFAVLASDFVQMFLVVTITITVAVLTLAQPAVGGISGLVAKVPSAHFHWTELARPQVVVLWIIAQLWFKFSDANNIENSTMYLMAKSDKDARRMVLIPLIGSIIGPIIWFIPSMAATITHPNLAAEYPTLGQPHEAAFVAVSRDVMPSGLLALLICAMLGATLTSMDAALNKNVGVFVRSLYRPLINPLASEKRQLLIGKIATLVFGTAIVLVAIEVNKLRTIGLFDLTNLLAATLLMPMAVPLIWGLFFKRTPGWSAWSTALVGFGVALLAKFVVTPSVIERVMGWNKPLSPREATDLLLVTSTFGTVIIGSGWFFFTSLFYQTSNRTAAQEQTTVEPAARGGEVLPYAATAGKQTEHERIEQFFVNLKTPIDATSEGIENQDEILYRLMGSLCLVYGAFILFLMLIPNSLSGRFCFLFCGGTIFVAGGLLYWRSRVLVARKVDAELDEIFRIPEPREAAVIGT